MLSCVLIRRMFSFLSFGLKLNTALLNSYEPVTFSHLQVLCPVKIMLKYVDLK